MTNGIPCVICADFRKSVLWAYESLMRCALHFSLCAYCIIYSQNAVSKRSLPIIWVVVFFIEDDSGFSNNLISRLYFFEGNDNCCIYKISKIKNNKIGVINDPLGQTHSHASREHCFLLFCFSRFEKWGRTDNMCENNDPYRSWLWVGRVDQFRCGTCLQQETLIDDKSKMVNFPTRKSR